MASGSYMPPYGQPPPPYQASAGGQHPPLGATASAPMNPQAYQTPMSKIEIHISCRNLLDLDVFSKSDPMCVVFMQGRNKEEWREVGRTETIMNTLNPNFAKGFMFDYFFEEMQMLKFEVYDIDAPSADLSKHDFIGRLVCSLGSIVGENGGRIEHHLQNPKYTRKSPGTIIVTGEEISSCKDVVTLHMIGKGLDKKDFFGKSDPFVEIERCNEDSSFSVVHRTEVIKVTLNPQWKPFTVPSRVLCNGDNDRTMRFKCYDWDRDGGHKLIGQFDTTLNDLKQYQSNPTHVLINPKKQTKKKYKNSGTIHIVSCQVEQRPTFLDYIRGGTELAFSVAIDFTASNGNPSQPSSLHYLNPGIMTNYVQALSAIGSIIEDYDTDKLFPAFGFGAKIPPAYNVSHEFPLTFNVANPMCQGMDGIIAAYYNCLQCVQLYGPTNFAPVINSTARLAQEYANIREPRQYFVLLIITDGIISDMMKSKQAIVNAARLPMSIIIVGVGDAEFDAMEELDGDEVRISYNGVEAERDIVQFVPFRDYVINGRYDNSSGARLAKDVLQELPDQFLEYMEKRKMKPMQR